MIKPASTSSAFYVRNDTDNTLVLTPLVHFRSNLGTKSTNIDVVYTADVWTSASIDIRTAATAVKVTEQRDEIDLGVDHERRLWQIGAGYRFSHEVDYLSSNLALSVKYEAFQRNTVFEGHPFFSYDLVGRSGDRFFFPSTTNKWLMAWSYSSTYQENGGSIELRMATHARLLSKPLSLCRHRRCCDMHQRLLAVYGRSAPEYKNSKCARSTNSTCPTSQAFHRRKLPVGVPPKQ